MKKILTIVLLLTLMAATYAQKDVTKFLGIPVDGTKSAMIQKLKAKGFTYNSTYDVLEGEFNGSMVNVYIVTNRNKVCRISVCDAHQVNETDIRIRFNTLCRQFSNNPKYVSAASLDDCTISDEEDISYEMSVNSKRYEALYYQVPEKKDSITEKKEIHEYLLSKYSEEQLANPTEELRTKILMDEISYFTSAYCKKSVWFMIGDYHGKYYIAMFYDNEYNRADGEDL